MKKFLLLMYYSIYKVYYKFSSANPLLTYKLPFAKRYFAKRGIDPTKAYMDAMTNPDYGIATIFAGGLVASSLGLFLTGLLFFLCGIFKINIDFEYQMFASFIIAYVFFYFFVWNKVKEVKKEFKRFDKMKKWKKYMWLFITLIFIVIAIFIWFKGMIFWSKNISNFIIIKH